MSAELINEIKHKKPTIQELKRIFQKHHITSSAELQEIMMKHDLLKYIKKDAQYKSMKEKADKNVEHAYKELSSPTFKNAIKSLKNKLKLQYYNKSKKTRKNKILQNLQNLQNLSKFTKSKKSKKSKKFKK
jgi:hypothetical protein